MMQIYYMFRRSAKKWNELKRIGDALHEHILKPVRAQGTRWIDHRRRALLALDRDYLSLSTHFDEWGSGQRKDVTPADAANLRGYLAIMKSHKFVLYFAAYLDIKDELADLFCSMQAEDLPVMTVSAKIVNLYSLAPKDGSARPPSEECDERPHKGK